jgi:hypothetical protein
MYETLDIWILKHLRRNYRVDQGSLHPSIKHLETDMSRPGFEPRPWVSTKELSRQLIHLIILIRYTQLLFDLHLEKS